MVSSVNEVGATPSAVEVVGIGTLYMCRSTEDGYAAWKYLLKGAQTKDRQKEFKKNVH